MEMTSPDELRTIVLRTSGIEVHVSPFGATLTRILVPDKHGVMADVALGYDDLASYDSPKDRPYFGAIVGRVANRIANAKFSVTNDDGVTETFDALAANNGPNCLHGGAKGFDRHWWTVVEVGTRDGTTSSVRLTRLSPDGEEGFPGNCAVDVLYSVKPAENGEKGACLHTTMTATVDKPCPVNLAQHTYFNLAGHDGGRGDADAEKRDETTALHHSLKLFASQYTPVDSTCVPTGALKEVKGTPFDFLKLRRIGQTLPPVTGPEDPTGFDHNYAIDGESRKLRPAAEAFEPRSGRRLELKCDVPGVQLYTGNFLNGQRGKGGVVYQKHSGFCLETQHFPDAVNQSEKFETCVVNPGETYAHRMVHRFYTENE